MFARINLSELRPTTLAALYVDCNTPYDRGLILRALVDNVGEEDAERMISEEMDKLA